MLRSVVQPDNDDAAKVAFILPLNTIPSNTVSFHFYHAPTSNTALGLDHKQTAHGVNGTENITNTTYLYVPKGEQIKTSNSEVTW